MNVSVERRRRWWHKCHFSENTFMGLGCRSDSDVYVWKNFVICAEEYMRRKRDNMYERVMKNFVYMDRAVIECDS